MNAVFIFLIFSSFIFAALRQWTWVAASAADTSSPMNALTLAIIESSKSAVTLALGLVGVMAFFLGLMKIAEKGGLLLIIAKLLRPLMVRLFPDVPSDHPAMGAMIMNIAANVLGLGNAATPFGIKAMQQLNTLNEDKTTASNAMVLFLAINTSSVTLLPTGVIALRASAGSTDPAGILPSTLFATLISTTVAILAAKFFQKFYAQESPTKSSTMAPDSSAGETPWMSYLSVGAVIGFIPLAILWGDVMAPWMIPVLVLGIVGFGWRKNVPIYETFVEGAKDGFDVALKIIPYLVAIMAAVAMFRDSGALDFIIGPLAFLTEPLGLPTDALPMALLRPLSGSGAYGVLASTIENPAIGPDSYVGYLVSTLQGSTETTFYVLAVYFGAVGIRRLRHGLITALSADLAGIVAAVVICKMLFT